MLVGLVKMDQPKSKEICCASSQGYGTVTQTGTIQWRTPEKCKAAGWFILGNNICYEYI